MRVIVESVGAEAICLSILGFTNLVNVSQGAARRHGEARRLIGSRSTKANTPLHPPRSSYSERYEQKSQVEQVCVQYKRYWTF